MEQQTPCKEKVLVVDDDSALCELVSQVLRLEDHVHIDFKNRVDKPVVKDLESLFLPFGEGGQSFGIPMRYRFIKNRGDPFLWQTDFRPGG